MSVSELVRRKKSVLRRNIKIDPSRVNAEKEGGTNTNIMLLPAKMLV